MKIIIAIFLFVSVSFAQGFDEIPELSEEIINSIKNSDYEILKNCQPPIEILYDIAISMGAEIDKDKFLSETPYIFTKLQNDFKNIINDGKENNIELDKLKLEEIGIHSDEAINEFIFPISIKFSYMDKTGVLTVTLFHFNNKYYISEVLISSNVFSKIFEN